MSAYVVSTKQIDAILSLAVSSGGADKFAGYFFNGSWRHIDYEDVSKVGSMLLNENIKSVSFRYTDEPKYLLYSYVAPRIYPTPIQALKLISNLDYQSCEHPEWETSEAKACLTYLTQWLIAQLPGYDSAAWSI